jgi:hypothetical protein
MAHLCVGHCYLMQDDLQKAYSAYQQALFLLPNPKVSVSCVSLVRILTALRRIPSFGMALAFFMTDTGR